MRRRSAFIFHPDSASPTHSRYNAYDFAPPKAPFQDRFSRLIRVDRFLQLGASTVHDTAEVWRIEGISAADRVKRKAAP
jgi:hypothetical protein